MAGLKYLALALALGSVFCPQADGQPPPPHCAQSLYCLFNQEAAASDPAGIHKYSRDVVDLILPNQWTYGRSPSGRMETFEVEFLGEKYAAQLADRLARAEQMARAGKGKLVAEADVVRAFNELMAKVGAPASMRTDEASMRSFREHAASIKAFPALLSADRNGSNCNPGEAVFLLHLLMSDDGKLYDRNLDTAQELTSRSFQQEGSRGSAVGRVGPIGSSASAFLSSYSRIHDSSATMALFNNLAGILGF